LGFEGYNILVGDFNTKTEILDHASNDVLVNGNSSGELYGDAYFNTNGIGTGGDDILRNGNGGGVLVGDVGFNNVALDTGGNDHLYGGAGAETMVGDVFSNTSASANINYAGNDYLEGGAGNDFLYGDMNTNQNGSYTGTLSNEGSDILFGGEGNDFLQGGTVNPIGARDYFVFDLSSQNGTDTIRDYYPNGDNDTLVFLNVKDMNDSGGADISDLLDLTSVTDDGFGHAVLNLFNDTGSGPLVPAGLVFLQQFNGNTNPGIAFNPVGPQNIHGGTEITDYITGSLGTNILINPADLLGLI